MKPLGIEELQTSDNNFSTNVIVLGTLVDRLKEIQGMNPNSFEYNTAIQQITAQEQGEAHRMLLVFEHCWDMASYPIMWGWYNEIFLIITCLMWWLAGEFGYCLLDL